ncbi:ubiquitin ligase e3 alpha-related [Holotrichia oblita]|uniref:Ubiquitin ligase e3 alpha-related n=1 Tax=Holotrichia oblita TaxID=644536 RepID=A0ACB9T6I6_HOLOL|nr:ubiquitin ligase e3 alpha-related [Holotrichia oblita]
MVEPISDVEITSCKAVDTKEVVKTWMEKFSKGVLFNSHFEDHWLAYVPSYYGLKVGDDCLNFNFNEDEATKVLLTPLEEFICNGNPSIILQKLSQFDKSPAVCGKVFKMGERIYSCRECSTNYTCVLCVDCFKKSEHRHHKYKMRTSVGSGYCDCGDIEVWKKAPFCETHLAGTLLEVSLNTLPEDLVERMRVVYDALETSVQDNVNTFCTVLYNDESHTNEQVVSMVNRVIKCSKEIAAKYVMNIDHEGRAIIKCSNFQHCTNLKAKIERYALKHDYKPLKVLVLPVHIVAYQIFAMKLLSWLQTFLGHGTTFRRIFSEVALKSHQSDPCIIEGILLCDLQLWKSARIYWQRLIISGMLLEYENKKAFAKVFMKNYGSIVKNFIKDDHQYPFSVASLSVQVFSVPTLAHHLIAYDDALFILLNIFLSECLTKCNISGKLEFESYEVSVRAQNILCDLRQLLSAVTTTWTDDLRCSFLKGLAIMLDLLNKTQGMDVDTRQIGAHMEFQSKLEITFSLNINLAYCNSLISEWCGTNKIVLAEAYRTTLLKLMENPCYDASEPGEVRELAGHSITCLPYDVSSKPASIHLPLSRFLAGLHLHLEKYGLEFDGPDFLINKPTMVQIIEPVLRIQVMISQMRTQMWRRNGYNLYFYHNVKWRTEMLDRDVILLQIGASLIESNEFLIHLLHKFNLLDWADSFYEIDTSKDNEEDTVRQTITLIEEFLQLIIVIIGERHIPGISEASSQDRIKKEIIQHLCIKPLLHSELSRIIPEDLLYNIDLNDIIYDVATLKERGCYELKEELYDKYNIFFYHYTKEEVLKSAEVQISRRKAAGLLQCCPPPKLPILKDNFKMIVNILQCDVMLHIMRIILEKCIDLKVNTFSEMQLHKILHLIGYALQEEQSNQYAFLRFSERSLEAKIPSLIEELLSSPRAKIHNDLIKWILSLYKTQ